MSEILSLKDAIEFIEKMNLHEELLLLIQEQSSVEVRKAQGREIDQHSGRLLNGVIDHLDHVVKFGKLERGVDENGYVSGAQPEYLKAWVLAGFPGIDYRDVRSMVNEKYPDAATEFMMQKYPSIDK